MTPNPKQLLYQGIQQQLQQIQTDLTTGLLTPEQVKTKARSLQNQMQMALGRSGAETDNRQLAAIYTEINKQFRLLGSDFLFWQAARQAETRQQRQQQIQQRFELLYQYCEMILTLLEAED